MRIRTIKPEFWTSLTITALSRDARLTFIGLWNYVDDEGRGICDSRLIKAAIWPVDEDMTPQVIHDLLVELFEAGLITTYAAQQHTYLSVNSWKEHQSISKPRPSKLPELSDTTPVVLPAGREGKGREQGKEGNGLEAAARPLDNNPNQPTDRQLYFGEALGLSIPAIVKLNKEHGRPEVLSAMEQIHGFPPAEGIEDMYGYVATVADFKAAGV